MCCASVADSAVQITLGLLALGIIKPLRAAHVVVLQLLAGICAAAAAHALTPYDASLTTNLAPGMSIVKGLFLEMFLTAQLALAVFFLAVEKHKATFVAPIGIGASLFIDHLVGVAFTGASMNPARSFGPSVIYGFSGYHWIYWLGPVMGSGLAVLVYRGLKFAGYPLANPTADFDDVEMLALGSGSSRPDNSAVGNGAGPSRGNAREDGPSNSQSTAQVDKISQMA
jgi:aquaporin related protein